MPPLRASLPSLSDVKSRLANSMSSVRNAALAGALGLTLLTGGLDWPGDCVARTEHMGIPEHRLSLS